MATQTLEHWMTPIDRLILASKKQKAKLLLLEQAQKFVKFIEEERLARGILDWRNDKEDREVLMRMRQDSKHATIRLTEIASLLEEQFGICA